MMPNSLLTKITLAICITASLSVNANEPPGTTMSADLSAGTTSDAEALNTTTYVNADPPNDAVSTSSEAQLLITAVTTPTNLGHATQVLPRIVNTTASTQHNNVSTENATSPSNITGFGGGGSPPSRDFFEFRLYEALYKNIFWVTTLPGIVGNSLCMYISLTMKPFSIASQYIFAMASVDFSSNILRFMYRIVTGYFLHLLHPNFCKTMFYVVNTSLCLSNFILVCWTVERFIAVYFPLKMTIWCTQKNTTIVLLLMFGLAVALSIPYAVFTDGESDPYGDMNCIFEDFMYTTWIRVDNVYYIFIPLLVIFTLNSLIIGRIYINRKAHALMTSNEDALKKRAMEQRQMTAVLVIISCAFCIFNIPNAVAAFIQIDYIEVHVVFKDDLKGLVLYMLMLLTTLQLSNIPSNINFILYCISGKKFRSAFVQIICAWKKKRKEVPKAAPNTKMTFLAVTTASSGKQED